jgi:hypothetical protein
VAIPDELQHFVKEGLARGLERPALHAALRQAGWDLEQVDSALATYSEVDFPIPVPRPRPYLSAREAFLYLVLFSTLYISAINLGSLFFQFINLALPDSTIGYTPGPESIRSSIRWAVSSLIVAFPVFIYVASITTREIRQDPAKRGSKVRRWLTYLTLFIASGVIIGDLIALLNDVLGGELTVRFLLKAIVVAVIAAGTFLYYLRDLRKADPEASR